MTPAAFLTLVTDFKQYLQPEGESDEEKTIEKLHIVDNLCVEFGKVRILNSKMDSKGRNVIVCDNGTGVRIPLKQEKNRK